MAKKFSSKDLFESEDIFKGIRDSAEKTLISLNKINDEFKQTATTLKQSLGEAKFDSSDSIKKFTQATAEANKIQKQSIEIQKLQEQVKQQAIKSEKEQERLAQERIKTQKAESQEKSRLAAESAKAVKASENEASGYAKLSKELNNARKAYKDLAVQNQENTVEGQQLLKQVQDLDAQLKKVDATVGQHQRNVGNYEGATKNLKTELRALTRELMNMSESDPKFQQMAQRAGELKDQITDTQNVVKATAGSAMENFAGSVAKVGQIGVAAFQGMESSMVLLGVENEAVLQSMQKLQALAGLGDALKTLGGLGDMLTEIKAGFTAAAVKMGIFTAAKQADTTATVVNTTATEAQAVATVAASTATTGATLGLKLLRMAMIATGIGAVVVLVGLLIANFDKLMNVFAPVIQGFKDLGDWIGITSFKQDEEDKKAVQRANKRVYELNKEKQLRDKLHETMKAAYENQDKAASREIALLKAQGKDTTALERARLQATIRYQTNLQNESFAIFNQNKEKNDLIKTELYAAGVRADDFKEYNKFIAETGKIQKDLAAENAAANEARKDAINQLAIFEVEVRKRNSESQSNSNEQNIKSDLNTAKTKTDITRKLKDDELAIMGDGFDKEMALLNEKRKREKEEAEKQLKEGVLTKEDYTKLLTSIDSVYESDRKKIYAKETSETLKAGEFTIQNLIDTKKEEGEIQMEASIKKIELTKDEIEKQKDLELKAQEQRKETIEAFADKTTEYFKKKSDEKISQIDKEIAAAEKQSETLKGLAESGNINAQQSLAENQRIINEANLKKEKELKKQKRMEAGLAIFKLFSANADKKNPLAATIADTTGLLAFISSLPMFYDGTEDTGSNGQGIDGKGGFHAVLHPNERVLPKSLNEQIGSMSNEQLTKLAQEYQNGQLVSKSNANSGFEMAILVNEMRDLKEVIKNKPETNIALGEITQSAMNIVESKRTGNTTVYNRFRINK